MNCDDDPFVVFFLWDVLFYYSRYIILLIFILFY